MGCYEGMDSRGPQRAAANALRSVLIAIAYVVSWWVLFATGTDVGPEEYGLQAFIVVALASALLTGFLTRGWWAPVLPLIIVPVLALPWGYTPGGAPDYGLGIYVGIGFLLLSVPATLAGVIMARRLAPVLPR